MIKFGFFDDEICLFWGQFVFFDDKICFFNDKNCVSSFYLNFLRRLKKIKTIFELFWIQFLKFLKTIFEFFEDNFWMVLKTIFEYQLRKRTHSDLSNYPLISFQRIDNEFQWFCFHRKWAGDVDESMWENLQNLIAASRTVDKRAVCRSHIPSERDILSDFMVELHTLLRARGSRWSTQIDQKCNTRPCVERSQQGYLE